MNNFVTGYSFCFLSQRLNYIFVLFEMGKSGRETALLSYIFLTHFIVCDESILTFGSPKPLLNRYLL